MTIYGPTMLAAVAASAMTRECNVRAFNRLGRSALASDMLDEIAQVFQFLFEPSDEQLYI